jgi:hypothetical protein
MNYTKDFHEYANIVKNTFNSYNNKFHVKYERYGALDKCSRVLREIVDVDRNIETITASNNLNIIFLKNKVSKKSSPFNDTHLKFSAISDKIKKVNIYLIHFDNFINK